MVLQLKKVFHPKLVVVDGIRSGAQDFIMVIDTIVRKRRWEWIDRVDDFITSIKELECLLTLTYEVIAIDLGMKKRM